MLSKLEKGLTKVQVQYIMGTPSIKDPFNSSKDGTILDLKLLVMILREVHYSLIFQENKLSKWNKKIDSDSNEDVEEKLKKS